MVAQQFEDYRWLVDEGRQFLDRLANDTRSTVQVASELRGELPAARARLVLEQLDLRRRAAVKFPLAATMFFTRLGLQQATDHAIAAYKAQRFPQAGQTVDLCCGIGGDLLALSAGRSTVGMDQDKITALLATANLRGASRAAGKVVCADVRQVNLKGFAAWHCDPDRRPAGRRRTRPDRYEPPVDELLARQDRPAAVAVKLAPAADVTGRWLRDAELEWIGHRRECQQLVAWYGDLARYPGQRAATVLGSSADDRPAPTDSVVGHPSVDVPVSDGVGGYLFEPHAAVLASRLEGVLAKAHDLRRVCSGIAYFTGDNPVSRPALATFRVLGVTPYRKPQVNELLHAHHAGSIEIKMRGVAFDPRQVQKSLRLTGDRPLVLILFPRGNSIQAAVAERGDGA